MSVGCDEAFLALPALATIAGAIGTTRRVYLGRDWSEPAVVFGCIVGESSTMKSPALARVADPVRDRQQDLIEAHEAAVERHENDLARWTAASKAFKAGDGPDPGDKPAAPTLKRIFCADTTIERLAELLHDNPRGLLVIRDELSGWLNSFTQYKGKAGGSDLPNWLEMHRAGPIVVDRKTGERKFTFVPRAAVSVIGGIQPGILAGQLTPEFMASGLTARVLFAFPPRRPKVWVEDEVSADAVAAVARNLDDLYALDPGMDDRGKPRPTAVRLSAAAKDLWVEFYNSWGRVQHAIEGDTAAAFGKIEAYAARFALLHHVVLTAAPTRPRRPSARPAWRPGSDWPGGSPGRRNASTGCWPRTRKSGRFAFWSNTSAGRAGGRQSRTCSGRTSGNTTRRPTPRRPWMGSCRSAWPGGRTPRLDLGADGRRGVLFCV